MRIECTLFVWIFVLGLGLGSYFSRFILVFDDLTMLVILHVVDDRVYRQWGTCDDSSILKPSGLVLRKCSYPLGDRVRR